jgi:SAM-dependent methyltransferase
VPYWSTGLNRFRRLVPQAIWQMDRQDEAIARLATRTPVLDVGAGGRVVAPDVITVDAVPYPGTRVVADIFHLPFRDGGVAGIISTGTLEHVIDPPAAVREFGRVLAPEGEVHVEVPFIQPYHADPHDYWRFTHEGLEALFRGWRIEGVGSHMGSGAGAAWVLRDAVKGGMARGVVRNLVHVVLSVLVQPLRLIDRRGRPGLAASGYWLRARPPDPAT